MSIMEVMERDERKRPRARRSFTGEFKAEIVELCQRGDRSIGQVSWDFDLTETAVREWVRLAERDAGTRGDGGLTSQERQGAAPARSLRNTVPPRTTLPKETRVASWNMRQVSASSTGIGWSSRWVASSSATASVPRGG
jgi:transposase